MIIKDSVFPTPDHHSLDTTKCFIGTNIISKATEIANSPCIQTYVNQLMLGLGGGCTSKTKVKDFSVVFRVLGMEPFLIIHKSNFKLLTLKCILRNYFYNKVEDCLFTLLTTLYCCKRNIF